MKRQCNPIDYRLSGVSYTCSELLPPVKINNFLLLCWTILSTRKLAECTKGVGKCSITSLASTSSNWSNTSDGSDMAISSERWHKILAWNPIPQRDIKTTYFHIIEVKILVTKCDLWSLWICNFNNIDTQQYPKTTWHYLFTKVI